MARNLAQRLDRLERLAAELLNTNQGPIYLRDGEAILDGIDPERVVTLKRVFIDPQPICRRPPSLHPRLRDHRRRPSGARCLIIRLGWSKREAQQSPLRGFSIHPRGWLGLLEGGWGHRAGELTVVNCGGSGKTKPRLIAAAGASKS
jgi:hypothetical protein